MVMGTLLLSRLNHPQEAIRRFAPTWFIATMGPAFSRWR